jgi:hypothetical protein
MDFGALSNARMGFSPAGLNLHYGRGQKGVQISVENDRLGRPGILNAPDV